MGISYRSGVSRRLKTHLELLGFTIQEVSQILSTIEIWSKASGSEWTVGRLKSLKQALIQKVSGGVPDYSWIASSDGNPKGVFRKMFVESNQDNHRKVNKALSALMSYTAYLSDKVTDKQYKKTVGSIQSEDVLSDKKKDYLHSLGERIADKHIGEVNLKWQFYPASLGTGKPGTNPEWFHQKWNHNKWIESFLRGLSVPYVSQYLERRSEIPSALCLPPPWDDRLAASPGDIAIIQERGYKARVIAMPHASIQVALYPLHQLLNQILKNLETDCTHNQEDGANFAQKALQAGKTVYSVDLSGATDNFPRSVQIGVLRGLGLADEAKLIDSLSGSEWKLSPQLRDVEGEEYVRYTKGQPQGLYSSFPLFGLTHNLVLTEMCSKLNIEPKESFRVLGDDVVITDSGLNTEYREFLNYVKVPVSEDKSLSSNQAAEFAGFLITRKAQFKAAKVPNGDWSNGFMNYLKVVGYQGLKQFPARVRSIARKAAELPEESGGLGLNPHGKSLDERLKDLSRSPEHEIPKYVGLKSSLTAGTFVYQDGERVMVNWLNDQFNHYEEYVKTLLSNHRLGSISTEPHGLGYQLSLIYNDMLEPVYDKKTTVGNVSASRQLEFESEFSKWSRLLSGVNRTFDKYNKSVSKQRDKDWKQFLS